MADVDDAGAAPREFICPLTLQLMKEPVIDCLGDTYERCEITRWYLTSSRSPLQGVHVSEEQRQLLIPNRALKSQIESWVEKRRSASQRGTTDVTPPADQQPRPSQTSSPSTAAPPDNPRPPPPPSTLPRSTQARRSIPTPSPAFITSPNLLPSHPSDLDPPPPQPTRTRSASELPPISLTSPALATSPYNLPTLPSAPPVPPAPRTYQPPTQAAHVCYSQPPAAPPTPPPQPPLLIHECQKEEMHWMGRRWYSALPAATRRRWDELQHNTSCSVDLMMELQGEEFASHKELLFSLLGDLDGDGILTPDEMRAVLYISSNFISCTLCAGPLLLLDGYTCLDCMDPPYSVGRLGQPWICGDCWRVARGGVTAERAQRQTVCQQTGQWHVMGEMIDIRDAFQLKLSGGDVHERIVRALPPLHAFPMDIPHMLARTQHPRRVLMLRCALGLTVPVDFMDEDNWTPLHVAGVCGMQDAVRFLVLMADSPQRYVDRVLQGLMDRQIELRLGFEDLATTVSCMQRALEERRQLDGS